MRAPWAVVCDFDGTATVEDIGDKVATRFAGQDWWERVEDDYRTGAYGFGELLRRMFAPITATPEEIGAFARAEAVLRHGFVPFLAACRERGVPFVLCSAGLDVYILPILEDLPAPLRAHVEVRCNEARCSPSGLDVAFHGNGAHGGCGRCGFCKGTIVEELRARGHKVAFVGDGTGDRCGARAADLVFARRRLVELCRADGVPFRRFESFDDVLAGMPAR
jgi:2-hydroxy-3-keto-5-methylthiopentenyl-1-phosphate phosphatase